jgi:hypothetical protein
MTLAFASRVTLRRTMTILFGIASTSWKSVGKSTDSLPVLNWLNVCLSLYFAAPDVAAPFARKIDGRMMGEYGRHKRSENSLTPTQKANMSEEETADYLVRNWGNEAVRTRINELLLEQIELMTQKNYLTYCNLDIVARGSCTFLFKKQKVKLTNVSS